MENVIKLKNGVDLQLDMSSLFFEYLEEYEDGIKGLKEDIKKENDIMIATNHVIYSMVCANYDEELTYRQAIRLVKIEDIEKIINFVIENLDDFKNEENKQKRANKSNKKHRKV